MHTPDELKKKNRVSKERVILMVILQHAIQTFLGIVIMYDTPANRFHRMDVNPEKDIARILAWVRVLHDYVDIRDVVLVRAAIALYWWGIPWLQFWFACFVMDAWEYLLHRTMHEVRFLYRMLHSHHHRLYVPYAFGALYNHPLEGMLLDTFGAEIARVVSFMTLRQTIVFFTISTFKTVCDHCGYAFPWYYNPIQALFPNNAEYHDVHHQSQGLRFNYSQPYFVHFDTIFGTRVDPADFRDMLAKKGLKFEKAAAIKAEVDAQAAPDKTEPDLDDRSCIENARGPVAAPRPKLLSVYTTASIWSVFLFTGILVVPVLSYSMM